MAVSGAKTFRVTCDRCHKASYSVEMNLNIPSLAERAHPKGWEIVKETCYSSDHYYKDGYACTEIWCPACMEKRKKKS
jgi:hypothetical protein